MREEAQGQPCVFSDMPRPFLCCVDIDGSTGPGSASRERKTKRGRQLRETRRRKIER